MLVKEEKSKH